MPIPNFSFDDKAAGLPRAPVPVRYACMAADWSPALLAEIVCGDMNESHPLITVFEYDSTFKRAGQIPPHTYERYREYGREPLRDQLARLPVNHFVWSDDLVYAFSDYIDLCIGRESAAGLGIRWKPALSDCAELVAESLDLSDLFRLENQKPSIRIGGKVCTANYNGTQGQFKDSKGLRYIVALLEHPDSATKLSVGELELLVNPPHPEAFGNMAEQAEIEMAADKNPEDSTLHISSAPDQGMPLIDRTGIQSIKEKILHLDEQIEDAEARGEIEKQDVLEQEKDELVTQLGKVVNNKGRPRTEGSTHDKIRKAITNSIRRSISENIKKGHPALGKHFEDSIRTGSTCSYDPSEPTDWEITISAPHAPTD